jgi:hypothetical protein
MLDKRTKCTYHLPISDKVNKLLNFQYLTKSVKNNNIFSLLNIKPRRNVDENKNGPTLLLVGAVKSDTECKKEISSQATLNRGTEKLRTRISNFKLLNNNEQIYSS